MVAVYRTACCGDGLGRPWANTPKGTSEFAPTVPSRIQSEAANSFPSRPYNCRCAPRHSI
jgi:hypothetical protein